MSIFKYMCMYVYLCTCIHMWVLEYQWLNNVATLFVSLGQHANFVIQLLFHGILQGLKSQNEVNKNSLWYGISLNFLNIFI